MSLLKRLGTSKSGPKCVIPLANFPALGRHRPGQGNMLKTKRRARRGSVVVDVAASVPVVRTTTRAKTRCGGF